jgi:hypothetical protein
MIGGGGSDRVLQRRAHLVQATDFLVGGSAKLNTGPLKSKPSGVVVSNPAVLTSPAIIARFP